VLSRRTRFLAIAVLSSLSLAAFAAPPRVVVLGFDGADHRLVTKAMLEGKLPNLSALAKRGGFAPLLPTIPAQTPVSWSTFSTGISPGRTLIFDFLKRDPKTYRPEFAIAEEGKRRVLFGSMNGLLLPPAGALAVFVLVFAALRLTTKKKALSLGIGIAAAAAAGYGASRVARLIPETLPTVTSNRRGTPFWELAGKKGIRSEVLHVPVTFPANDYDEGHLLSGLGVPDVRGRIGTPSYYTSDPFFSPPNKNEFSVELVRLESNVGTIKTEVLGPYNKLFPEPPVVKIPMTLTVLPDGRRLSIEPQGSPRVVLEAGQWSDWVTFTFPFNSLVKLKGIGRFHLASLKPEVALYLSPINFDPRALPPGVRISTPASWANDLSGRYGLFKTMGWQIDTWSMSEETIDEKTFLEDVSSTVMQSRKMMNALLDDKGIGLYVQIFEFTDRVAHCFWRFTDPEHPAYDATKAATWAPAIERSYREMDAIVGDAMKKLAPEDVLLVVSDHGFASWRRSVNYDTWLVQNGFMAMKGGEGAGKQADLEMLFGQGQFWPNVDWSRTKAYAMGLGEIYVNLKGREGQGIVAPGAEYESVRAAIVKGLSELVDPKNGKKAVGKVLTREEAYGSFDADLIPDLFVANTDGYRVSWQSSLGVVTSGVFEDNKQVWSGDHCSLQPDLVPGIFVSSRPLKPGARPAIADVPATVLGVLGVAPAEKLDGAPLF
jgi:predicted AlkP superfamily phosphohydrolase/phosphomutase